MTWLEWLQTVSSPLCFSTATTGISSESQLIAVAYKTEDVSGLLMRTVPQEELLPAFEYHGIDSALNGRFGVSDEVFKDTLSELFDKHTLFTYNTKFQGQQLGSMFEELPLVDLCVLVKGAESRSAVPAEATNSIHSMLRFLVQDRHLLRIPFKQMLEHRGIPFEAPSGVLPVEHNVECLWKLLQMLADYELMQ